MQLQELPQNDPGEDFSDWDSVISLQVCFSFSASKLDRTV